MPLPQKKPSPSRPKPEIVSAPRKSETPILVVARLRLQAAILPLLLAILATSLAAQTPTPLDPTRNLPTPPPSTATPLPEQYIWTANDLTQRRPDRGKFPWNRPDLRIEPHLFRAHFTLAHVPAHATLYLAGPREAHVFLNGHLLGDFASNPDAPINFRVFHADAHALLRAGNNLLAIQAIRGKAVVTGAGPLATQELAYGEVLAVKLLPAPFGVEAPALLLSDPAWRSSAGPALGSPADPAPRWSDPAFDDSAWPHVDSVGPIDANIDFLQWSADAGMYGWPGYRGMSAPLRTFALLAAAVTHIFSGPSPNALNNLESLTQSSPEKPFTVTLPPQPLTDAESPALLLDFGREVAGRLFVESASAQDATLSIAYGESELEALATGLTSAQQGGNYLGTNLLDVPANGIARGPKSAFRYVRIRFLRGSSAFKSIRLEGIFYPVTHTGSFESSDPLLNRIWETGAYTAHLCMQDGLWDAPKRDRGRWVGDIDVEGRVLETAFGPSATPLLEDTLRRLAEATPPSQHVNGIPSYTALWITSLHTLYLHSGDQAFLASQHHALLQLLARMDHDLGPDHLLLPGNSWGFVDWAPGLFGQTPETRTGTSLQYLRGYQAALPLLEALGDHANASLYTTRATVFTTALLAEDSAKRNSNSSWQLNTLAVLAHLDPSANPAIWSRVLAHVKQDSPSDQVISPYFGAYLLDAISELTHPEAALAWIRTYWGGMLAEGATSFWESYDLRWPRTNPHLSLQADGTSGFFVSLAHGWSTGPTAWLSENILGITPLTPGYDTVAIAPHLLGLTFARGTVPTPHGPITLAVDQHGITLDLPPGITRATVTFDQPSLSLDHAPAQPSPIQITAPGHHTVTTR